MRNKPKRKFLFFLAGIILRSTNDNGKKTVVPITAATTATTLRNVTRTSNTSKTIARVLASEGSHCSCFEFFGCEGFAKDVQKLFAFMGEPCVAGQTKFQPQALIPPHPETYEVAFILPFW